MLRLIHNQLGILIAPFIFIAALTGVLYGITPQLEAFIYHEQLIAKHESARQPQPISRQVAAALPYLPTDAKIFAVRTPINADVSTRILYRSTTESTKTLAIFVNPYTLQVQGQLAVYGTSGVLPLRTFLDDLHRSLLLGEVGRIYSELAASWLGIFAFTGLIQWCYYRKKNLSTPTRTRYLGWHYWLGLIVLPMLIFFSFTGLTWSKWSGANFAQIRHWLGSDTPTLQLNLATPKPPLVHDFHAEHHHVSTVQSTLREVQHPALTQFDEIITIARQNGLMATALQIKPSYDSQQAWSIEEMNHRWPIEIDGLAIDMSNQKIIDHIRFEDFPWLAKLTRWGVDLHIGVLFGLINQIILVGSGILILLMIGFAYKAWWSYQRPLRTLHLTNQSLMKFWQQASTLYRLLAIFALFLFSFLVPVWVISIVFLHLGVFIIRFLKNNES